MGKQLIYKYPQYDDIQKDTTPNGIWMDTTYIIATEYN